MDRILLRQRLAQKRYICLGHLGPNQTKLYAAYCKACARFSSILGIGRSRKCFGATAARRSLIRSTLLLDLSFSSVSPSVSLYRRLRLLISFFRSFTALVIYRLLTRLVLSISFIDSRFLYTHDTPNPESVIQGTF